MMPNKCNWLFGHTFSACRHHSYTRRQQQQKATTKHFVTLSTYMNCLNFECRQLNWNSSSVSFIFLLLYETKSTHKHTARVNMILLFACSAIWYGIMRSVNSPIASFRPPTDWLVCVCLASFWLLSTLVGVCVPALGWHSTTPKRCDFK